MCVVTSVAPQKQIHAVTKIRPELALGVGERLAEPLYPLLDLRVLALFLLAVRLQKIRV